ncbi:unnamed protein product [Boreogadus saida]
MSRKKLAWANKDVETFVCILGEEDVVYDVYVAAAAIDIRPTTKGTVGSGNATSELSWAISPPPYRTFAIRSVPHPAVEKRQLARFHCRVRNGSDRKGAGRVAFPPPTVGVTGTLPYPIRPHSGDCSVALAWANKEVETFVCILGEEDVVYDVYVAAAAIDIRPTTKGTVGGGNATSELSWAIPPPPYRTFAIRSVPHPAVETRQVSFTIRSTGNSTQRTNQFPVALTPLSLTAIYRYRKPG